MRTDKPKPKHGIKRKFVGGRMQAIKHPTNNLRVKTLLYRDNVTNLSGPITGGGKSRSSVMARLSKAMSSFGVPHSHGRGRRKMRGGCVGII